MGGMLEGKVAVITGAARGLGAAYAKAFAAEGAAVCVSDVLDTGAALGEIESAGGRAIGLTADVTDMGACDSLIAQTEAAFGGVDILSSWDNERFAEVTSEMLEFMRAEVCV